jgi:tRNA(Ile)-lysidine synthase
VTLGFAVAISGGRDSTALLHASLGAATPLGLRVHALHVHHNLQPAADAWLEHVRTQCEQWAAAGAPVQFHARVLDTRPPQGASIEAWAREQRYAALAAMARACGVTLVLLAHHRRDQAETFLLQALRGGGVAGLSAMPRHVERGGIVWARPWLEQPRAAIEAYVMQHRLTPVDDPSNDDARYARSRIRTALWPALQTAFPDAEASLAAAATHAQEARSALDELAEADLALVSDDRSLRIDRWRDLSPARRALVLRAWLRAATGRSPGESLVRRLLDELDAPGPARWPLDPPHELRRYRGRLSAQPARPSDVPPPALALHIAGLGDHDVPAWRGTLRLTAVHAGGVALERLRRCELRPRQGGEQFRLAPDRPARQLKKQFQAASIGPWTRDGPLLYCDGRLVFVPGLGIHADELATAGEPQAMLEWLADEPGFAAPQ